MKWLVWLALLASVSACASRAEPAASATVDGTPSEIKDQDTLASEIDQYNEQSNTGASALNTDSRTQADDRPADPAARDLANEVNAYNNTSEPDDSSSAIDGRQPTTIERQRTLEQQRATRELSEEVRNYNRNGGTSSRISEDTE
ncbi:MAG: hypothetical protein CMP08_07470 [Xanthomonadales bacterium]|nr:hypothetical protein [Xanthomonadales bacterium]